MTPPAVRRRSTPLLLGLIAGTCALPVLLGGGCERIEAAWDAATHKKAPPAPPPPQVAVAPARSEDVPITGEWLGVTDGMINAVIRAQVSGYLRERNYTEGSVVKVNQVLFTLDDRPFVAAVDRAKGQLAEAQARLEKANLDVKRYTPLAAEGAISQQELDDAIQQQAAFQASVESANAQLEEANLNLGFTRVTSLIDGVAGIANAQVGDLVGPSSGPLTSVSSVDPIRVYFPISEQDYIRAARAINDDTEAHFVLSLFLADGSEFAHPGKLLLIDRQVDPRTGTIRVVAEFPNPGNLLRPGQYARIRAVTRTVDGAVVVPQRAVSELQGQHRIFVVQADDTVAVRTVEVGPRIGSDWVITTGLQAGESVVIEGFQKLRPGMKVTTTPWTPTPAPPTSKSAPGANPAPSSTTPTSPTRATTSTGAPGGAPASPAPASAAPAATPPPASGAASSASPAPATSPGAPTR